MKKRILSFAFVFILAFSLAGCISIVPEEEHPAEVCLKKFLSELKHGDVLGAFEYMLDGETQIAEFEAGEDGALDLFNVLAATADYKILSLEESLDIVFKAKVRVTTPDMSVVLKNSHIKFNRLSLPENLSDEECMSEFSKILKKELKASAIPKVSEEYTVMILHHDGKPWKVLPGEDFFKAIYGGLTEATNELFGTEPTE